MTAGCHDNHEIDTFSTVMAVGIEKDAKGKLYTFAISDTGSYNSESSGDKSTLICYSARGKNLRDAIDNTDRKISRKLSFSHLSVLLFSKDYASENIYPDVEYFEAHLKARPQVMIALTGFSPEKYLSSFRPELEVNPEKYFRSIFQNAQTYVPAVRIMDFSNAYNCRATLAFPLMTGNIDDSTIRENNVYVSSCAIVHKGKIKEIISDTDFMGLLLSERIIKSKNAEIRSVEPYKMNVDTASFPIKAQVVLTVESNKKFNKEKLESHIASELKKYAESSCDITNLAFFARKNFLTERQMKKYDFEKLLKTAEFNVKIKVLQKGMM